ncbi:unnamed protein product [Pleuronectes platessa]|uniref:Uncharacterized protein n=1 Tax=Pleuronectes platessa TaxID=8262 RepID=A0A9N7VUJ2_PLEPL|nr:unnamed protein product [Pleuronectes platessa]
MAFAKRSSHPLQQTGCHAQSNDAWQNEREDGALTKDLVCDLRGGNFTEAGQSETKCEGLPYLYPGVSQGPLPCDRGRHLLKGTACISVTAAPLPTQPPLLSISEPYEAGRVEAIESLQPVSVRLERTQLTVAVHN